jgi:hypothetical protein
VAEEVGSGLVQALRREAQRPCGSPDDLPPGLLRLRSALTASPRLAPAVVVDRHRVFAHLAGRPYSPSILTPAVSTPAADDVLADLLGLAQDATLVGHNVWFDWRFILTAPRAHGLGHSVNDEPDLSGLVRMAAQLAREARDWRTHPRFAVRLARWLRQHGSR